MHKKQQFSWTHHHHNYDAEATIMQTQTSHHPYGQETMYVEEKKTHKYAKIKFREGHDTKTVKHAHPIPEGRNT